MHGAAGALGALGLEPLLGAGCQRCPGRAGRPQPAPLSWLPPLPGAAGRTGVGALAGAGAHFFPARARLPAVPRQAPASRSCQPRRLRSLPSSPASARWARQRWRCASGSVLY